MGGSLWWAGVHHFMAFKKYRLSPVPRGYLPSQEIISLEKKLSLFLDAGY